ACAVGYLVSYHVIHRVVVSPTTSPSVSFFSSCDVVHRHLHPFPTRRSSDLGYYFLSGRPPSVTESQFPDFVQWKTDWFNSTKSRSEEHTSELQSRFDLVCRLLLEKKNVTL